MNKKGFTMIELLAVIGIISIIGSMVTFQVASSLANARESSCFNRMQLVLMSEKRFYAAEGRHSAELLSGTPINANSEIVEKNYYLWQQDTCEGDYYWIENEDNDFELHCTVHTDSILVLERAKLRNDVTAGFPDDNDCLDWDNEVALLEEFIAGDYFTESGAYTIEENNTYKYGFANDYIDLGNEKHIIFAGDGNDYIKTGNGKDIVFGEGGHDKMVGENAKDTFDGGSGCDLMYGNNGEDTFDGGSGNDYINGGLAKDNAIYHHPIGEYQMREDGPASYTIWHPLDGKDTLIDVETLIFADGVVISIEDAYDEISIDTP